MKQVEQTKAQQHNSEQVPQLDHPKFARFNDKSWNYKTVLCDRWERHDGNCTFRENCLYAHGQKELEFGLERQRRLRETKMPQFSAPSKTPQVYQEAHFYYKGTKITKSQYEDQYTEPVLVFNDVDYGTEKEAEEETFTDIGGYAHLPTYAQEHQQPNNYNKQGKKHPLYRTMMCKNKQCPKTNCDFAHTEKELRKKPNFQQKSMYGYYDDSNSLMNYEQ